MSGGVRSRDPSGRKGVAGRASATKTPRPRGHPRWARDLPPPRLLRSSPVGGPHVAAVLMSPGFARSYSPPFPSLCHSAPHGGFGDLDGGPVRRIAQPGTVQSERNSPWPTARTDRTDLRTRARGPLSAKSQSGGRGPNPPLGTPNAQAATEAGPEATQRPRREHFSSHCRHLATADPQSATLLEPALLR